MKPLHYTVIIGSLLIVGCQSSNLLPSKLSTGLFGPAKTQHTLSTNTSDDNSPSALQLSSDEFRQGESALQKGNLKQAKNHFVSVVKKQPRNAAAHHRLGYIADKLQDYTTAEIHYITAMKIEPSNADIACDLGYSYLLQDRLSDARRYLEKALIANPQHQSSLLNMATLVAKQGDYNGSLAIFRQAGSEQEAQENIARLFPGGRPAGNQMVSTVDRSQKPLVNPRRDVNQMTKDLQREMAALTARQRGGDRKPVTDQTDLNQLDPREIPVKRINDIFAQIDREFEQKQNTLTPRNRSTIPPHSLPGNQQSQDDLVAQNPRQPATQNNQTIVPVGNQVSSIPGELPSGNLSHPLNDYAILQPQKQPATTQQNNLPNNQNSLPQVESPPVPQTGSLQQYPVSQNTPLNSNVKTPSQSQSQVQNIPGVQPGNRTPAATPNSTSYQQAVAMAVQMGMNAGPGQMFPVSSHTTNSPMQDYPSGNNYPNNFSPVLPASSQPPSFLQQPSSPPPSVSHQGGQTRQKYQHPFQHLPLQSSSSNLNVPIQAQKKQPNFSPGVQPSVQIQPATQNQTGAIRQWAHSPNSLNSQYQQVSGEQNNAQPLPQVQPAASQTPWFKQPAPQNNHSQPATQQPFDIQRGQDRPKSPAMQPHSQYNTNNVPPQWQHSPQSGDSQTSANRPVVHRRAEVPSSAPSTGLPVVTPRTPR